MLIITLFANFLIFLQALDVTDVTSLISAKELTVNGLLLVAIIMLWRRMIAAEEKIDVLRKEKETDFQKYVDILLSATKVIDENTKMYADIKRLLEKQFDK